MKKILYIDMDNVLVDFSSALNRLPNEMREKNEGHLDDIPGVFALMDPLDGAIESYHQLAGWFDTYILSTAPWDNHTAWSDKLLWVKRYLGASAYKQLILTHHKNLNHGDFLVDDRTKHGADQFAGELILFGSTRFPDWPGVVAYLHSHSIES